MTDPASPLAPRRWPPPLALLLSLAAPLLPAPAWADDAPADADPKVKATAFALPHPDVAEATMVEVMRTIEGGLKKNPRLDMKELDTRLADFAQETPTDVIDAARGALKDGEQALSDRNLPLAVARLDEAVARLAQVLPYIKKQELADAMATLAVARYQNGDRKGGQAAFVELLTWRPDYVYDAARMPAQLAGAFDEAARQVEKARRVPVLIRSEPAGAQAYIDGRYIGITPCTADGQPVGRHFVTLKKEGYKKAVAPVEAARKGESVATIPLERSEKYLLVEQARAKVEGTLGQELIAPEAENLKTVLFVEHAVFVKAAAGKGGKVDVDAWLYDLRTRHLLSHVHQAAAGDQVEAQLASLPQNLYLNVSYEGALAAPVDKPPPQNQARPVYKTWWFWTALGAGVVVVGGAAAAGYLIYQGQAATCDAAAGCIAFQP